MPEEIPRKLFYKLNEVCQLTDTQPYVLRFWESEFAQLAPTKSRNGQRLYRRKDIDLVLTIKKLLNDEGFTIAGAREKLGMNGDDGAVDAPFDPQVQAASRESAAREVTEELERILKIMDATDERLSGRRGLDES
jgi:DNA-binding transcriptional MerR regulator